MGVMYISNSVVVNPQTTGKAAQAVEESTFFGQIFDAINPLQHIPIVSNIYRAITGDSISSFSNIVGGAIFGGPVGAGIAAATEVANAAINEITSDSSSFAGTSESINLAELNTASGAYKKAMRVTTSDWLNHNFSHNSITA